MTYTELFLDHSTFLAAYAAHPFWTLAFVVLHFIGFASLIAFVIFAIDNMLEGKPVFYVFDSNRKVGGIRFLRINRLNVSISISKRKEA